MFSKSFSVTYAYEFTRDDTFAINNFLLDINIYKNLNSLKKNNKFNNKFKYLNGK